MKTALWTVTFAHKSLWDEFQTWLKSRGLRTWVMGREEDEVSHGIGFAGCREKDCDNMAIRGEEFCLFHRPAPELVTSNGVKAKTDDKTEETREAGLREAISATLRQAIKSSDKPESSNG